MVRCLWNGQKERLRPERGTGGMRLPTQREALESPGGPQRLFSHAKRYPTAARCLLGSVDKKDTRCKHGRKTAEEKKNLRCAHCAPQAWWTIRDSNPGPTGYEPAALTN